MRQIFSQKANAINGPVDKFISKVKEVCNTNQFATVGNARASFATESLHDDELHSLVAAGNELSTALESICSELGIVPTEAQIQAATLAGIAAGDYKFALSKKNDFPAVSTESMGVVQSFGLADALDERSFGLEAYAETENRNAVLYSIAYNMQAARQDEFGETWWPTLVITPDNAGFGITVNLMMVFNGVERKISGTFEDFKKRNIIRAVADPTILHKEQTRITPVVRPQSADKFVAPALIAPATVVIEGESIVTAPIATGKKVDILGLSETDSLLATGIQNQTDSLDRTVNLVNTYVKVGDDILKFNVQNLPLSNFTYSTQNNYRVETLNFTTTSVLINKNTKRVDGSDLVTLAGVVTDDLIVRLELNLNGTVNIETGELQVFGNVATVYTVQDNNGNLLDLTIAPAKAIVDAYATAQVIGYDILAYRSNLNRRQLGQFIDVTKYTQLYNVPLRSPITTIHPASTDDQTDSADVQALLSATRIRTSNEAVTALVNTAGLLREYVDSRDSIGNGPDLLGVGRFFVRPTYYEEMIDMAVEVDSLTAVQRPLDIQAALINKIRDVVFRLYRDSEYKAADDALSGGISTPPVVILGTDPVLARYLQVNGDLRTIGGGFDVRVVSTLDPRVEGRVFIGFSKFDENRNVAPNPLNFGNLIWAPELVLTAKISRQGQYSKETVCQPRYLFVTHTPILGLLNVENVPDVLGKLPLFTKEV